MNKKQEMNQHIYLIIKVIKCEWVWIVKFAL